MMLRRLIWTSMFCAVATIAQAGQVLVDFEEPTYDTGKIVNGEGGWQATNPAYDQEVITGPDVISGSQSWRMSRAFATGSFGDQPFSPATDPAGELAANNFFQASMLFRPLRSTALGDGVTISIDNGTGARGNWMGIEYTANGWVLGVNDYDAALEDFVYTPLTTLTAGSVYSLGFDMQFNPGANNDVWRVFLDGALVFTGVGWEDYFRDWQASISPVTYDRLLFRSGGTSAGSTALGVVFDDISYGVAAVPEPSTLALGGTAVVLGLCGWLRRRRAAG